MRRYAMRGFVAVPAAAAAVMMLVGGCSSGSSPSSKPTVSSSPTASDTTSASGSGTDTGSSSACSKVEATLSNASGALAGLATNPSSAKPAVTKFINELKQDVNGSSDTQLKTAVDDFGSSVQKALSSATSGSSNITSLINSLTADAGKITAACTSA